MHPTLLQLGNYRLPSYVVLIALAGAVSLLGLKRLAPRMGLRPGGEFWLLVNLVVLFGFAGGRLLSFLLHSLAFSSAPAPLFSDEGLPTFGVLAGAAAAVCVYSRWLQRDSRAVLDGVFLVAPLGHGIARIGCFLAGCCYGRPAAAHLPWTAVFTNPNSEIPSALLGVPLHPVQLYEAAGDFLLAAILYGIVRPRIEKGSLPRGTIAAVFFAGYGALRFVDEFFRGDTAAFFGAGLTVEQVLALAAILAGAGIICSRISTRAFST